MSGHENSIRKIISGDQYFVNAGSVHIHNLEIKAHPFQMVSFLRDLFDDVKD